LWFPFKPFMFFMVRRFGFLRVRGVRRVRGVLGVRGEAAIRCLRRIAEDEHQAEQDPENAAGKNAVRKVMKQPSEKQPDACAQGNEADQVPPSRGEQPT